MRAWVGLAAHTAITIPNLSINPIKKVAFFKFFVYKLQIYVPIRPKITQSTNFPIDKLQF